MDRPPVLTVRSPTARIRVDLAEAAVLLGAIEPLRGQAAAQLRDKLHRAIERITREQLKERGS